MKKIGVLLGSVIIGLLGFIGILFAYIYKLIKNNRKDIERIEHKVNVVYDDKMDSIFSDLGLDKYDYKWLRFEDNNLLPFSFTRINHIV